MPVERYNMPLKKNSMFNSLPQWMTFNLLPNSKCSRPCRNARRIWYLSLSLEKWTNKHSLKGCGMGPSQVLVSPCFRENVVATCKIGSFCVINLDNLLQKNVIVLFFGNQISKWRSFEKRAIFDPLSHFLVTREKLQKFLQHISHSHTYTYFAHPIDFFCLTNFEKKNMNLSDTVSLWYESWCWFLFAPFWNNQ